MKKGSPEAAVQDLLTLRSKLVTDAAKYAALVDTSVAEALAADSRSRSATRAPTPQWTTPVRTSATSETAEVTVTWKADAKFKTWPEASIFSLKKNAGGWIVIAAREATSSTSTTRTP